MTSPQAELWSPERWQNLTFELLWVYRGLVPTTGLWSGELAVPAGVFFVLQGGGQLRADGRKIVCRPGEAFLSAPGKRRQFFEPGSELLSVAFSVSGSQGRPLFCEGLNRVLPAGQLQHLRAATEALYRSVNGDQPSVPYREAIQARSVSLLERCRQEVAFREWFFQYVRLLESLGVGPSALPIPADERVAEAIRRLDAWPIDQPFDRTRLALGLGLGWRRLQQLTQAELGVSPSGYLEKRRLEVARHRLAMSLCPLKETAYELGFRHASHFTMWFRRLNGEAPTAFRERQRTAAV